MDKKENKIKYIFTKILNLTENIVYYLILIPLVVVTLSIVYQQIVTPEKIPHIFGWKMFIILDQYMDESLEYGDLVFTKNINSDSLTNGNIVAFRNSNDMVVIHKIIDIKLQNEIDSETKEQRNIKTFTMQTAINETSDTKYVKDSKIEGILKYRIPFIRNNYYYITATTYNDINNLPNTCNRFYSFIYCRTVR